MVEHRVKAGLYRDSVALMQLSRALLARPGVTQASVVMATPANREVLAQAGLPLPADRALRPDDLLVTVAGEDPAAVHAALDWAEAELAAAGRPGSGAGRLALTPDPSPSRRGETERLSTAGRLEHEPGSLSEAARLGTVYRLQAVRLGTAGRLGAAGRLAVISVPGEYAYAEALKALKLGLDVFLFSSHVSVEDEARLKQMAARRGRLVMGPDCGTALLDGRPLGFANAVRRGGIGLVAASGSGLQEVMCLIDQGGGGVSQAVGTGGRDLHEQVGGLSTLAGIERLGRDPETRVMVLLSKPAAPAVTRAVLQAAAASGKPVVAAILGAKVEELDQPGVHLARTLEDAACQALRLEGRTLPAGESPEAAPPEPPRRWVRGLFVGGTLCTEARLVLAEALGPVAQPGADDPWPAGHWCQDLGDEALTRGRPHPMIDGRLRAARMAQAAADPTTAVVLFDVVLGYGASPDPLEPLLPVVRAAPAGVRFVAHVCGTEADPQRLSVQAAALRQAGVAVRPSNAAAARLAARWGNTGRAHE